MPVFSPYACKNQQAREVDKNSVLLIEKLPANFGQFRQNVNFSQSLG
jgi:hypothetical protein